MLIKYFIFSALLLLSIQAFAKTLPTENWVSTHSPLPFGERITLQSVFLTEDEVIDVYLPNGFKQDSDSTQYPLIITMDGWALSQTVSGIASHLMNTAALPNSIVVALHTDVWSRLPKAFVHSTDNWPAEPSSTLASAFKNNPHQAAKPFWQFLEKELIPYLEENYRANHFRTFVGMSPTAYMGLHTMLKGPDLFSAYILIAATDVIGLGYTQKSDFVDEIVQAAANGHLNNKFLYVASAEFEARREPLHYKNAQKLVEGLSPYSDKLSFKVEHIDHFGHYPVAIPALTNALNMIFPRHEFQKFQEFHNASGAALPKIIGHYDNLSERYGVKVNIPTNIPRNPNSLRAIGYKLLKQESYAQAEAVFTLWTQISDKDPNAYFWLSRAFNSTGNMQKAISHLEKAIAVSPTETPNNIDYFQRLLVQYKNQQSDATH